MSKTFYDSFKVSHNAATTSSNTKFAPFQQSSEAARGISRQTRFISDHDRQQLEKEAKEKEIKSKSAKSKPPRTEQQKLLRRQHDERKAREKKRLELISKAAKDGVPLTEDELNTQLQEFMDKREVRHGTF